jgi:carbon monoxide dehydrogenase subunit G
LSGRLSLFFNLLIRLLELSLQIALGRHLAKRFPLPYFHRTTWEEVSMDIEGEERVRASRDVVWRALNDPDVLKQCIPGCQSLEQASPTELQVVVRIKIGPVAATFNGDVILSNIKAPKSYTISGEGKGGIAGFGKGSADVVLVEEGPETILRYSAKAQVGGKLAQLGSRLIDSASRKLAQQFFADFNAVVGTGAENATTGEPQ